MADYISKYTGAQIDLAIASGSSSTGQVSGSSVGTGSFGAGYIDNKLGIGDKNPSTSLQILGDISASGDLFLDDISQVQHITASGNISSSGIVYSEHLYSSDDAEIVDSLTIGGTISNVSTTNITASGDISASGTVYAKTFQSGDGVDGNDIDFTDGINVTGHITASGNISSSGDVYADELRLTGGKIYEDGTERLSLGATNTLAGNVFVNGGNLSASGDLYISDEIYSANTKRVTLGSINKFEGDISASGTIYGGAFVHAPTGHITASGNISASGIVYAEHLYSSDDAEIVGTLTVDMIEATSISTTYLTSSIVSSSIVHSSGSNIFGDEVSDTHTFTGNITASGNISASGNLIADELHLQDLRIFDAPDGDITFSGPEINDSFKFTGTHNKNLLQIKDVNQDQNDLVLEQSVGGTKLHAADDDSDLSIYVESGDSDLILQKGVYITGSGISDIKVGIGDTTPDATLDVVGSTILGSAASDTHTFTGTSTGLTSFTSTHITASRIHNVNTTHITASGNISASGTITGGNLNVVDITSEDITSEGIHTFKVSNSQKSKFTNRLDASILTVVEQTGVVGIFTDNPTEKLTVEGNISSSGAINTLSHITASGNINSSGTLTANEVYLSTQTIPALSMIGNRLQLSSSNDMILDSGDDFLFKKNSTSIATIFEGGELRLGSANLLSPASTLEVEGDISSSGDFLGKSTSTGSFGSAQLVNLPIIQPTTTGSLWLSGSDAVGQSKFLVVFTG